MSGAAHIRGVIIASPAGILFGFDTALIARITHLLREFFSLSPAALEVCALLFFASMMTLQFVAAFFL